MQKQRKRKHIIISFAIDGNINGTSTTNNRKTTELVKVDENGKVNFYQE